MHLFSVRGLSVLLAGAVLAAGSVFAVASQQSAKTGSATAMRVQTPAGPALVYGFDTMAAGADTAQVRIIDGFGYDWCFTTTIVGPGQWTATGTVLVSGCPNPNWIASAVITQVAGINFNVTFQAVNPSPDGCVSCTSCFVYSGTWNRTANQGGGNWNAFCQTNCTSPLSSGTWSAVGQPGGC